MPLAGGLEGAGVVCLVAMVGQLPLLTVLLSKGFVLHNHRLVETVFALVLSHYAVVLGVVL